MKIALIGPKPPPFGGMAKQTRQLTQLLADAGMDVRLIATNPPYPWVWLGKTKGLRAVVRLVGYILRLWRELADVDCVHLMANSGWSWQLFAAPAIWLAWLRKIPIIVNYHGGEAESYFQHSFRWVKPSLDKASVIVVPSGFLRQVFGKYGVDCEIIANIVDLQRFQPKPRFQVKDPSAPHLIVTRNLEKLYGIDDALLAISLIKQRLPGVRLTIAGDGPEREALQRQCAQLALEAHVAFTGRLDFEHVIALYQQADILLNPSRVDNMPGALLEAMASGVPIVSTDAGGIPFMVEDGSTTLLVAVGDAQAMADAVIKLVKTPELYQNLAKNGLNGIRRYTWAEIGPQWLNLYRRITEQDNKPQQS